MNRKIMIIGATSAIAEEVARCYATSGAKIFLIARQQEKLQAMTQDLKVRGATYVGFKAVTDITQYHDHQGWIDDAEKNMEGLDIVLIAHGMLPNQKECEKDFSLALGSIETNLLSIISLLTHLATKFEEKKGGTIAVISSVAGERGRQSNYIYGTAKAALNTFLQGLRNRLYASNVQVLTIKPGFVDTPMTANIKKGPLFSSKETVAKGICQAIDQKKDVVYLPGYWFLIMTMIKLIPELWFKRTNI